MYGVVDDDHAASSRRSAPAEPDLVITSSESSESTYSTSSTSSSSAESSNSDGGSDSDCVEIVSPSSPSTPRPPKRTRRRGPRNRVWYFAEGLPGRIEFDIAANKLIAVCRCEGHGKTCSWSKTLNVGGPANPGHGRPLGLLFAWLCLGPKALSGAQHRQMKTKDLKATYFPLAVRVNYRLKFQRVASFKPLFESERKPRIKQGETSEPEDCP